ncbi:MAG: cytochrome c biogenesis protein CcsA [Oligoflexales bacterium]
MNLNGLIGQLSFMDFAVCTILFLYSWDTQPSTGPKIGIGLFTFATLLALIEGIFIQAYSITGLCVAVLGFLCLFIHRKMNMPAVYTWAAPGATLVWFLTFLLRDYRVHPLPEFTFNMHLAAAVMGCGLLLSASIIAGLYLWQQRALKQRKLDQIGRVPPLDVMQRILNICLGTGFFCLTFALVTGSLLSAAPLSANATLKFSWAIGVWLWYLLCLLSQKVLHLPVKTTSKMSLVGFLLLSGLMLSTQIKMGELNLP